MSNLPMKNYNQMNEQQYSDMSNPYAYPSNPTVTLTEHHNNYPQQTSATFESPTTKEDPELKKITSSFWKRTGQLQSAIGSWTGNESWKLSGERTIEEADREYRDAETKRQEGAASRLHGEYDRLMGYATYIVGHVAGDNDMQMKANQRTEHGKNEIQKSAQ